MDSLADTVASLELDDNETMPYGSSHWDGKPAELHAMILKAAGPLTLFVNGLLGDKDSLNEATVEALWTEAISIDWHGDLALLPDINLYAGEASNHEHPALGMFSLPVSRSMYGRLCARFPSQALQVDINERLDRYLSDFDPLTILFETTRLRHIPMRNGWFDLVDFPYPIALGWQAIYFGYSSLLRHLTEHHGIDLEAFQSLDGRLAMDLAATSGYIDILQMLHDAGNTSCSTESMDYAAMNGHLDVVQWLHENRTEGCTPWAMDCAANSGHSEVVQFLLSCGYEFTYYALHQARSDAIVDVLVDSMTLERATEMLQTARAQGGRPKLIARLKRAVAAKQA